MAGVPAHPRDTATRRDIDLLRARGLTAEQTAKQLGMSKATLYRIVNATAYKPRGQRR